MNVKITKQAGYRIGWEKNGKWYYINVESKADMLAEVDDKMSISDKVRVKRIYVAE